MRVRRVGACAVVVLALAGLSACRTKVGAAAFVGDQRISQSEVTGYLLPGFTSAPATSGQAPEPPRVFALNTMIESRLLTELLGRSLGGVPADADLDRLHDEAMSVQLGVQATGSQADQQVSAAIAKTGLKTSFAPLFLRDIELKQAVIDKINAQSPSDVAGAVNKIGIRVKVNERYGTWSASTGALSTFTPDYLNLDTAAPAPAPAGG